MIYKDFQGLKLSQLGFGTMRLPLREDKSIDAEQAAAMTSEAIAKGVNYFDTAWPYHSGKSELVIGEILKQYPRESFYLADKFPGHQIAPSYDVKGVFERQLKKCGVEYFDFYLLHNVYENSIAIYEDERWNILPYLLEQKKNGRIRHLGFSTHAGVPALEAFLEKHANEMEFCQIELNYLDWTLQQAKEKCELLNRYGIPIWVMEPVRGGKLANLPAAAQEKLHALRPEASDASWALRWVQEIPGVTMILSGMSNMAQMQDNLATFDHPEPLSAEEQALLLEIAEGFKSAVPCTACRYCCDGCPQEIDSPQMLRVLNELRVVPSGFASLAAVWQVPVFFLGSFLALVVLFLLVVLVSCLFVDPKKLLEKPSGYFRFLLNEFCRIALALGGVHVNVTGLEKVPRESRFLLVSNHRFAFDPIVFYAVMPWAELAFLSKKENFSIFIVAQVMREVLCLPVDRNNDRESLKSILKAIQFIKDDKASIAVFPEGGTNKTADPLLPYRSGVFKIAQKANVPIVVCSLVNSRAILHNMFRKHTEVWLDVLDVVPAEELAGKTAIEVGERIHAVMEAGIVAREKEQGLRA